jgi:aldose 1-epimerase
VSGGRALTVLLLPLVTAAALSPGPIRFTLRNDAGMVVELAERGAAIARVALPSRAGLVDVAVGSGDPDRFATNTRRFGAIVGRYAGRLRGAVTIDGTRFPLATNAEGVTLHGGDPGFDRATWRGRRFTSQAATGVEFTLVSPDGAQGFPGTLTVIARYSLARRTNTLSLDITATTDRRTVVNLTHHVYWNLSGRGGTIACHRLSVDADREVALDTRKLPTGALEPLRAPDTDLAAQVTRGGMDRMLLLMGKRTARLTDRVSGRRLTLTTDQPGLQVYSANGFDGSDQDQAGRPIARFGGVALEPGNLSDAPNIAGFPNAVLSPGERYRWHARWAFSQVPPRSCVRRVADAAVPLD